MTEKLKFPSFATGGGNANESKFSEYGFLSDEADKFNYDCEDFKSLIEEFKQSIKKAHATIDQIKDIPIEISNAEGIALALWGRTLESCSAAVILSSKGMASVSGAPLRTGLESLFWAGALWRDQNTIKMWSQNNKHEKRNIARAFLKFNLNIIDPNLIGTLQTHANDSSKNLNHTVKSISKIAGMEHEYEMLYRTLSNTGIHASLPSIKSFYPDFIGDRLTMKFGPNFDNAQSICFYAKNVVNIGQERMLEFLQAKGISLV